MPTTATPATPFDAVATPEALALVVVQLLPQRPDDSADAASLLASALPIPPAAPVWDQGSPQRPSPELAVATGRVTISIPTSSAPGLSAGSLLAFVPGTPPLVIGESPLDAPVDLQPGGSIVVDVQLLVIQTGP